MWQLWLYNTAILIGIGFARVLGLVNVKARLLVAGRKTLLRDLKSGLSAKPGPVIWVHCASLGEFEQGRPVIDALKREFPTHRILLTFFSPSGYEVRKNYPAVDFVCYLPFDRPSQARAFVQIANPVLAIFVKYEFWPNLFNALHKKHVPILSISAIFRPEQAFFQVYGGLMRKTLNRVTHFFVQDDTSKKLLDSLQIKNVTVSGDTRFDRVHQVAASVPANLIAEKFKNNQPCWVVGSCWQADFDVLQLFIHEKLGKMKFIIAPHEISKSFIAHITKSVQGTTILYSQPGPEPEKADVLIIDNVGMLSQLYRYGEFAYVGGGFGKGLHNILEPACFGIPVFFGAKNYSRFREAIDLVALGGAMAVHDFMELNAGYEMLAGDPDNYHGATLATRNYIDISLGATEKIVVMCRKILNKQA